MLVLAGTAAAAPAVAQRVRAPRPSGRAAAVAVVRRIRLTRGRW
jgi:hypothetical protein